MRPNGGGLHYTIHFGLETKIEVLWRPSIVDSQKSGHGCRMISAGFRSCYNLGSEDRHVATFCLLL